MKQGDKQLLFKDLCARLPYNVVCQFKDDIRLTDGIEIPYYDYILSERHIELFKRHNNFFIKPYLRPMSSMTEEEKKEYHFYCDNYCDIYFDSVKSIDFLNSHHFDYRNLIKKGLAIEVTEENNPYKI